MAKEHLLQSLSIINTAFTLFNRNIAICFNGGKDSTCLLELVMLINQKFNYALTCIFIEEDALFEEMKEFVLGIALRYFITF